MHLSIGSRLLLATAVCTILAAAAFAVTPIVGPQQRIDVAGGTDAANETTGAASSVSPDDIIAGWNDWRDSGGSEVIRAGYAISTDGGQSWIDDVLRPPDPNQSGVEGDPMAAFDERTGNLWLGAISFSGNGGLYVARKNPGDAFFQPSVMADPGSGVDKCWMVAGRNELTADSTRLYIAYNFGVVQSDDLGDTWSGPASLGDGLGFLPRIGPNGEFYVAYWSFGLDRFDIKRSTNGGANYVTRTIANRMDNWSVETFNTRFPGSMRVPPLVGLAVNPSTGTLYAVWPDTTDFVGGQANVDVYFSRSFDQGDSWSTPVVLNGEGPNVGDQFFPWVEADPNGGVHVLYLDTRNTAQNDNQTDGWIDAYYAFSDDDGDNWQEFRLTDEAWNSDDDGLDRSSQFIGDYLGMAVTDETVWPIYPDSSLGDTDTYTNKITICEDPPAVSGLTIGLSGDDTTMQFNWVDVTPADDYILYQDLSANGVFGIQAGTATSGTTGISTPAPILNRYYLVAGRTACGVGPLR